MIGAMKEFHQSYIQCMVFVIGFIDTYICNLVCYYCTFMIFRFLDLTI